MEPTLSLEGCSLEAVHLEKSFNGHIAVKDLSFTLNRGQVFGLLGTNGAGKTTTMLMLAGLLKPDSGEVRIDGVNFRKNSLGPRSRIGWVPETLAVYPELTVRENLYFFGGMYGMTRSALETRIRDLLELFGLMKEAKRTVETLSNGTKRKLNFAVGLIHQPTILILDEPTSGLDAQTRNDVLKQIRKMAESGISVVYASHDLNGAQQICDWVAILNRGHVVVQESLLKLLQQIEGPIEIVLEKNHSEISDLISRLDRLFKVSSSEREDELHIRLAGPAGDQWGRCQIFSQLLTVFGNSPACVRRISVADPTLEQIFLRLTQSVTAD